MRKFYPLMVVVFEGLFLRLYWITWNVSQASQSVSCLIFVLGRLRAALSRLVSLRRIQRGRQNTRRTILQIFLKIVAIKYLSGLFGEIFAPLGVLDELYSAKPLEAALENISLMRDWARRSARPWWPPTTSRRDERSFEELASRP